VNKSRCQNTDCHRRLFCSWCRADPRIWDGFGGSVLRCSVCLGSAVRPAALFT
jgi:hypothetical protein